MPAFRFSSRRSGTAHASRSFDILIKVSASNEKVSRRNFGTDARRALRFVLISVIAEGRSVLGENGRQEPSFAVH